MHRKISSGLVYPAPRYGPSEGNPPRTRGRISAVDIDPQRIALELAPPLTCEGERGRVISLYLVHRILLAMLRAPGDVEFKGAPSNFDDLTALTASFPIRRLNSLEPLQHPPKLPMTAFDFHLVRIRIVFSDVPYHRFRSQFAHYPSFLFPEGIFIYTRLHQQPFILRVSDEIHAIMRLCELRSTPVTYSAVGFLPTGDQAGEILYLLGQDGEIIGENPLALDRNSAKGARA